MEKANILHVLWARKSLIYYFAISDLRIRYKNSVLGFMWAFLEPLLLLGVLYVVFSSIFKFQIENFPLYLLLGIIMWNILSKGTEGGLHSLLGRSGLLTQIYFPREIPSISATITASIMLFFELIIFVIFMAAFSFVPSATIVYLPLILILELVLVLGISLPLSVLMVRYRDVQFIWPVIITAGFFLTPIFYKFEMLPEKLQTILQFSPMVQIIIMARDVTLYNTLPSMESILIAVTTTFLIAAIGYGIFRKLRDNIIQEL